MIFHIAYACNALFAEQTAVSITSLLENNRMHQIVIYLVEDHMHASDLRKIRRLAARYGALLHTVPLHKLLQNISLTDGGRHPDTIYAKLFLDQICTADRILYLDSDTVVAGSLKRLWEMDMEEDLAAGVQMPYSVRRKEEAGLNRDDPYLCDGILLMNLEKWRAGNIRERCVEDIRRSRGRPPMRSEGVVNRICRGHVRVLPPEYNLMSSMVLWGSRQIKQLYHADDYYPDHAVQTARKHPVIIHYLNELYIRPWYSNSDHPYRKKYLYYRRKSGYAGVLPKGSLGIRTRILRLLDACLPFCLFRRVYRGAAVWKSSI